MARFNLEFTDALPKDEISALDTESPPAQDTTWEDSLLGHEAPVAKNGATAWDQAHAILRGENNFSIASAPPLRIVEPDFMQAFPFQTPLDESDGSIFSVQETCAPENAHGSWPTGAFGWHLDDDYSQLRAAREAVGSAGHTVRVGILDTGYDRSHVTKPRKINRSLERNITGKGDPLDASDPYISGFGKNPGHGTATLAILAGGRVRSLDGHFDEVLGGAPEAEMVPVRISNSVIHFRTSSMAAGIKYAADAGCEVLSISMGGIPARSWSRAVNYAYEKGVAIFAAAGNRIGISPPSQLVFPARYKRVVGVAGFTADKTPYYQDGFHRLMQGCFGPESAMKYAMAAFTPNIPWAEIGCDSLVNPNGGGTSSATPQCASAAALWLQKNGKNGVKDWRSVEAVRHALFSSAKATGHHEYFTGHGLLSALDALSVEFDSGLEKTPSDGISFLGFRIAGAFEAMNTEGPESAHHEMFEIEAAQLYLAHSELYEMEGLDGADPLNEEVPKDLQKKLMERMATLPATSNALRDHLNTVLRKI